MKTRFCLATLLACFSAAFMLSPSAYGQTPAPVVKITAQVPSVATGPIAVLSCEEALHLFGSGGNLGSAKTVADPLTLVKRIDYTTALLRKFMTEGRRMPEVIINFVLLYADSSQENLLDLTLYDAFIPEIKMTASDGVNAVEVVKLQYPRVCWETYLYHDGIATPVSHCWNFETNKAFSK